MKLTLFCLLALFCAAPAIFAADSPLTTTAAVSDDTNLPAAPKVLGDRFTNSIDMELIKVGGFWVGKYEVTQKEFQTVTGANPSAFANPKNPVDSVSWYDAMDFCAKMTARDIKERKLPAGYFYTLPTEAEWDGFTADASLSDAVTSMPNRRGGSAPVGSLAPNSLGLYDTRGNVMEFCLGDASQSYRVLRGGSWNDFIEVNLRKEFRFYCRPDERQNTFGFRCIVVAGPAKPGA